MLTLYGVTRSRASRIVWLCHEIGLPFRQVPVIQAYRLAAPDAPDAPLNTRSPDFLGLSPQGAIPVIQDGDLVLTESMACTLYLAREYGGALGGGDSTGQARCLQWSFYAATAVEPDALTILMLHRGGRAINGVDADHALVAEAVKRLQRPLKVIDTHLRAHTHLAGDSFTVADLNMAEVLRYAQVLPGMFDKTPALRDWLARCQARPAFHRMWSAREAEPE